MKNDLKAVGVYVATLVGAGFASGSELVYYFVRYGRRSFFAIILSSFLFALFAMAVLGFSKREGVQNFTDFLTELFGRSAAVPVAIISYIFIFVTFCAMLSGSAETLFDVLSLPRSRGAVMTALTVFFVLLFGARGLSAVDGLISIIIAAGILCVCGYLYAFREIAVFNNMTKTLTSGVVYAGYNVLASGGVLVPFAEKIEKPKRVGIFSGIVIFVLMTLLWGIISIYYGKIPLGELPMLTICRRHGGLIYYSYFIVLFAAMLSTAISNAFLLVETGKRHTKIRLCLVIISGFLMSGFSLGFFVDKLYRAVGILGGGFMLIILFKNLQKIKFIRKTKKNRGK